MTTHDDYRHLRKSGARVKTSTLERWAQQAADYLTPELLERRERNQRRKQRAERRRRRKRDG